MFDFNLNFSKPYRNSAKMKKNVYTLLTAQHPTLERLLDYENMLNEYNSFRSYIPKL